MDSIPLYDPSPPHPDGWHRVRAPGGYEWWYFEAHDLAYDRQLVAIFFDGFVFHPGYLRADARYRNAPTRSAPALPEQFPCVYFALYENGRVRQQFMTQAPAGACVASASSLDLTIGSNSVRSRAADAITLSLSGRPWPLLKADETLSAQIEFRPQFGHVTHQQRLIPKAPSGDDHFWILADALADVRATLRVGDHEIQFAGSGYHDHNFGSAPLSRGVKRWLRGRVLLDNRSCIFQSAQPIESSGRGEITIVAADVKGYDHRTLSCASTPERRTSALLGYPIELRLDGLTLTRPRIIFHTPFFLRLAYDAVWQGIGSTAFCEIIYPQRLRWPLLGRLIEGSMDRRSAR